jgi:hypothetical protein
MHMGKFLTGMIVGCLATLIALTLFTGLIYVPAERQLIGDWRKIGPGMLRSEVEALLGRPEFHLGPGLGFPPWAERSIPAGYYQTHGLIAFYINAPGPQYLLVFLDEHDRVAFVTSTYT